MDPKLEAAHRKLSERVMDWPGVNGTAVGEQRTLDHERVWPEGPHGFRRYALTPKGEVLSANDLAGRDGPQGCLPGCTDLARTTTGNAGHLEFLAEPQVSGPYPTGRRNSVRRPVIGGLHADRHPRRVVEARVVPATGTGPGVLSAGAGTIR